MATNNSTLYLLAFNNYYNRTIKRFETIEDYVDFMVYTPLVCNFNPADGIDTEHVFNVPYVANTPTADYLIVADEDNNIVSRWFIVNATRNRGGQYSLTLHRDLIADYYNEVLAAPTYIERAIASISNPFIFNSEGLQFNQIKTKEVLLKDETGCGWYVGYVAADTAETAITLPTAENISYPTPSIDYETLIEMTGTNMVRRPDNYTVRAIAPIGGKALNRKLSINTSGYLNDATDIAYTGTNPYKTRYLFNSSRTASMDGNAFMAAAANNETVNTGLAAELSAEGLNLKEGDVIDALTSMSGNTYYDVAADKIFTVSFDKTTTRTITKKLTTGAAYTTLSTIAKEQCAMNAGGSGSVDVDLTMEVNVAVYVLTLTDMTDKLGATATIGPNVISLTDAPYKMFAIPAGRVSIAFEGAPAVSYSSNTTLSKNFAMAAATKLGSQLYDLQYLPYCPIRAEYADGKIILNGSLATAEDKTITFLKQGDDNIYSFMLWAKESNFSFNIQEKITIPADGINFKIANETKFCRLVSPNYNGSFQFKPTANYGVEYFEVNCSYKPFQPYIHINPHFTKEGLYGGDYNDNRGLVCGGDFSLPIATDNWINYQIQNSAYKDQFNRQVENMETTFGIQLEQQRTAGFINTITAGISGATTGGMLGSFGGAGVGVPLAAASAGLGMLASAYGAQKDLEYAQRLQEEAMSYTRDQFALNLQNIRALPYSLSKVGAFTIDNKIFPFVEFYEATEQEVAALEQKLKYRSMAIGAIDTIANYLQDEPTFIQGSVIRIDVLGEDYHSSAAIANEIHKGVYI